MSNANELNEETFPVWAIDATDGKLNKVQLQIFNTYLLLHPEHQEAFEMLCESSFQEIPENTNSEFLKTLLKEEPDSLKGKSITRVLFEYSEGNLNASENSTVEGWLKNHPLLRKELTVFKLTHQKPNETIHYADQDALLKYPKPAKLISLKPFLRVAAIFLLALTGFYFLYHQKSSKESLPELTSAAVILKKDLVPLPEWKEDKHLEEPKKSNSSLASSTLNSSVKSNQAVVNIESEHTIAFHEQKKISRCEPMHYHPVELESDLPFIEKIPAFTQGITLANILTTEEKNAALKPLEMVAGTLLKKNKLTEDRQNKAEAYAYLGEQVIEKITGKSTELKLASGAKDGAKSFSFKSGNFGISLYRP